MRVDELDVPDSVADALTSAGFVELHPPQADAIPIALEGRNLVAAIPTGGIAVDVNVTGNAQAAIRSSNGNIDSGLSYSRQIANEMME